MTTDNLHVIALTTEQLEHLASAVVEAKRSWDDRHGMVEHSPYRRALSDVVTKLQRSFAEPDYWLPRTQSEIADWTTERRAVSEDEERGHADPDRWAASDDHAVEILRELAVNVNRAVAR